MTSVRYIYEKIKELLTPNIIYNPKTLHQELDDYVHEIDSITYSDLMIEDFKIKYNGTYTSYGDEMIDHWLRSVKSADQVEKIQNNMKLLINGNNINTISKLLKNIGKQNRGHLISDLWSGFQIRSFMTDHVFLVLLSNITLNVLLSFLITKLVPIWILLFFLINIIIYTTSNYYISQVSGSINYLIKGISFIRGLEKKKLHNLELKIPEYGKFKRILWSGYLFKEGIGGPNSNDILTVVFDYFRVFFCLEILSFKATTKYLIQNIDEIRDVICFIGYYDCLINNLKLMASSEVSYSRIENTKTIHFHNLRHPLLDKPIAQSRNINKGVIITGLNMAGKSTFMKSLGLNQLLATSFGITFSDEYKTYICYIATSFRINDLLLENKSRYFAEAERIVFLNRIVKDTKALCLIDEILSGTNSDDRIHGSIQILKEMAQNTCSLIISATHDIKIAESLSDIYETCYFDGVVKSDEIKFEYKLKNGIVDKKNGLLILKTLGINI